MTEPGDSLPARLAHLLIHRVKEARFVLAIGLLLAVLATLLLEIPPLASLAGLAALILSVALKGGAATALPLAVETGPRSRLRPDAGMKALLDALADPCFLTDAAGILRFQNKAASEGFGPARLGEPLSFKLRIPEVLAAVESAGRGEKVEDIEFSERVPTERLYKATIMPVPDLRREKREAAPPAFLLLRLSDETERMRLERMRVDFIANASHELRTPLAALAGFIETLLGPARADEANRERFLKIMLEQTGRMARLIDDLLSLSRIEMKAHIPPSGQVDLSLMTAHVLEMMAPLAAETGVSLVSPAQTTSFVVRGDRDELVQVMVNLIENAIKYGREKGTVEIALRAEDAPDGRAGCSLTVKDDGPGIAPEHLPRLTERFYRADPEGSRKQKGTGLGLAIVKHIVNRHKGRLTIRSQPGAGAIFAIWLETVKENPGNGNNVI